MERSPLPANLAYACSHLPSIAEVCRRIGINRQQFNKYLSGQVRPSRRNMRLICDFFGVSEAELLLDESEFARLLAVRRRPARAAPGDPRLRHLDALFGASGDLSRYVGWYHRYFPSYGYPGKFIRSLATITKVDGRFAWKNVELTEDPFGGGMQAGKYAGFAFLLAERIHIVEYEMLGRTSTTQLILYPSLHQQTPHLFGLQTGGPMRGGRAAAASAVLLKHLGARADPRRALRMCGVFDADEIDPSIPELMRDQCRFNGAILEVERI